MKTYVVVVNGVPISYQSAQDSVEAVRDELLHLRAQGGMLTLPDGCIWWGAVATMRVQDNTA